MIPIPISVDTRRGTSDNRVAITLVIVIIVAISFLLGTALGRYFERNSKEEPCESSAEFR